MSDTTQSGPMLAADGTPLKKSLARALRREKLRALVLIAPLLVFVLLTFIAPIADMLFRSVENEIVPDTLPRTVEALEDWDPASGEAPGEDVFAAFYTDLYIAAERKNHTRLGTRLNYQTTGISSLFRQSGRRVDRLDTDIYAEQFEALDPAWADPETWTALFVASSTARLRFRWADPTTWTALFVESDAGEESDAGAALPETASAYADWRRLIIEEEGDDPDAEQPADIVYTALYRDLSAGADVSDIGGQEGALLQQAASAVGSFESVSLRELFLDIDEDWGDVEIWGTIKAYSGPYTTGYFLNAADLEKTGDGIAPVDENQRIYGLLFQRTLFMSLVIMGSCVLLGYPIAFLLANLPLRSANMLMILVLLPFWTSLLVRTSAWKVLLQQQGVINDVLVWLGLVNDADRLVMINNQFGTIVAMTHILLPFMILPLYSVMSTIKPYYVRAARSLGATPWTAFWRVYFPQSVPGIGAGCILVFILAIGYYITPELVGGTTGTFISNRIAYHISSSLNWGLAAALGTILLVVVLVLYWVYDKIVGIDNVKLG